MPEQKPSVPMLSLSLVAGLAAAIGALLFLAWLADEVPEGELQHFDDGTRAAVHQFASPFLTSSMLMIFVAGLGHSLGVKINSAGFLSRYPSATAISKTCFKSQRR